MHVIAAKAVALAEAATPEFHEYQRQVVRNAKQLAEALLGKGFSLVSGGTDNHLILIDLTNFGITGRDAQEQLEKAGITVNKNSIPFDPLPPAKASGIRLGTPAVTTRSMGTVEMEVIASLITQVLKDPFDEEALRTVRAKVRELCDQFPLYRLNGNGRKS